MTEGYESYLNEEYGSERDAAPDLSENDAHAIITMLSGKMELDEVAPDDLAVEEGPGESYTVRVEDAELAGLRGEEETVELIYDPSGEHCVTWGNAGTDVPPEGMAYDGDGDENPGIR
jgi:hypothetical protein